MGWSGKHPVYTPKSFRIDDPTAALDFIEQQGFAIVTSQIDGDPVATHCPMHLIGGQETPTLFGHFAKANPHCKALAKNSTLLCIFAGPHTYISPQWYKTHPAVPTWNYTTVHITGTPTIIDDPETLKHHLLTLTRLHDKASPDTLNSLMPEKFMQGMVKGLVGFTLPVSNIQMQCKLSQNRSIEDQQSVITQLEQSTSSDSLAVADAMRRNLNSQV